MKKSLKLFTLLSGLLVLAGCQKPTNESSSSQQSTSQTESSTQSETSSQQSETSTQTESSTQSETSTSSSEVHQHASTIHEATEPVLAQNGHKTYYECEGCDKYFLDEACTQEISNLQEWLNGEGKIEEVANEKNDFINVPSEFVNRMDEAAGNIWDGWNTTVEKDSEVKSPVDSTRSAKITIESLKDAEGEWKDARHAANKAVWSTVDFTLPEKVNALEYKYLEFDIKIENAQNWVTLRFIGADGKLSEEKNGDLVKDGSYVFSDISMDGWMHVRWNIYDAYNFGTLLDEEAELSEGESDLYAILNQVAKIRVCVSDSKADLQQDSVVHVDNLRLTTEETKDAGYADAIKEVEDAKAELIAKHTYASDWKASGQDSGRAVRVDLADIVDDTDGFKFVFKMTDGSFRFCGMDQTHGWEVPTGYYKLTKNGDNYTFINANNNNVLVEGVDYAIYDDVIEGWKVLEVYKCSFHGDALSANVDRIDSIYGKWSDAEEILIDYATFGLCNACEHREAVDLANAPSAFVNRMDEVAGNIWDGWNTTTAKETTVVSPMISNSSLKITIESLKDGEGEWKDARHDANKAVWSTVDLTLAENINVLDYKYLEFDIKIENAQNWITARFIGANGELSEEKNGDLVKDGSYVISEISMDGWMHVCWNIYDAYNFATLLDEDADLSEGESKLYSLLSQTAKIRFCVSDSKADLQQDSVVYLDNIKLSKAHDTGYQKYVDEVEAAKAELIAKHTYASNWKASGQDSGRAVRVDLADIVDDTDGFKFVFKMTDGTFRFCGMDQTHAWEVPTGYYKLTKNGDNYTFINANSNEVLVEGVDYALYDDVIEGWKVLEVYKCSFHGDALSANVDRIDSIYGKWSDAEEILIDYATFSLCNACEHREAVDMANAPSEFVNRFDEEAGNIWDGWNTTPTKEETVVSPMISNSSLKITIDPLKDAQGEWLDARHATNRAVWSTVDLTLPKAVNVLDYKYFEFDIKINNAQNWTTVRFIGENGKMSEEKNGDLVNSASLTVTKNISVDGWMHVCWKISDVFNFDTLLDEEAELTTAEADLYSILTNTVKIRFAVSDSNSDLQQPSVVYLDNIRLTKTPEQGYDKLVEATQAEINEVILKHGYAKRYGGDSGSLDNYIPLSQLSGEDAGIKFAFKMNDGDWFRFAFLDMKHGWAEPTGYFKITRNGNNYAFEALPNEEHTSFSAPEGSYRIYEDTVEGWMICEIYKPAFHGKTLAENVDRVDSFYGNESEGANVYIDYYSLSKCTNPAGPTTFAYDEVKIADLGSIENWKTSGKGIELQAKIDSSIISQHNNGGQKCELTLVDSTGKVLGYCQLRAGQSLVNSGDGSDIAMGAVDADGYRSVVIPLSYFATRNGATGEETIVSLVTGQVWMTTVIRNLKVVDIPE